MKTLENNYSQWVLAVEQVYAVDDVLPAGLSEIGVDLPPGAILLRGGLLVTTPSDATGLATADVGIEGGDVDELIDGADIKAAGFTPFVAGGAGTYFPTGGRITLTSALTDGATAGTMRLIAEYIITDRGNEVK